MKDGEISMLGDVTHLQEIIDSLVKQSADPKTLPTASENVILDIGNSQVIWSCQVCVQEFFKILIFVEFTRDYLIILSEKD